MADDRIALKAWDVSDVDDLAFAISDAQDMVADEGEDAFLSWALWNDKQTCANVGKVTLFKVVLTDNSAAYELELTS